MFNVMIFTVFLTFIVSISAPMTKEVKAKCNKEGSMLACTGACYRAVWNELAGR